jgi:hypothetical protein
MNLQKHVELCIKNAEEGISKIDNVIKNMYGMTGLKTRHFYNNLLSMEDSRYLEIGTWKGSSVCSAIFKNKAKVVCIDNWSEFGGPKDEFLKNLEYAKGENDVKFIENDCFKVDISTLDKFNIYMYDGGHSYEEHYKALKFIDVMDEEFIFIVDDWNWEEVRNGTLASIKDLNVRILYFFQTDIPNERLQVHDKMNWWNGIGVFIIKKPS